MRRELSEMLVICDKERWLFALIVHIWLKCTVFLYVILKTLSEIWMIHCYSSDVREEKQDRSLTRSGKRKIVLHWSMQCVLGKQFTTWVACVLVGWWRFPHLSGQLQEKLSEATPTTKVREHCTCFCWQGFSHAFVATPSSLYWPNTINNDPLQTVCICPNVSSIPKHLFRRDTGIRISVAHLSCQLINFQTFGIIRWYVFLQISCFGVCVSIGNGKLVWRRWVSCPAGAEVWKGPNRPAGLLSCHHRYLIMKSMNVSWLTFSVFWWNCGFFGTSRGGKGRWWGEAAVRVVAACDLGVPQHKEWAAISQLYF